MSCYSNKKTDIFKIDITLLCNKIKTLQLIKTLLANVLCLGQSELLCECIVDLLTCRRATWQ